MFGLFEHKRWHRLHSRVMIVALLLFIGLSLIVVAISGWVLNREVSRSASADLVGLYHSASVGLDRLSERGSDEAIQGFLASLSKLNGIAYLFYQDASGKTYVATSRSDISAEAVTDSVAMASTSSRPLSLYLRSLQNNLNKKALYLSVSQPDTQSVLDLTEKGTEGGSTLHIGLERPATVPRDLPPVSWLAALIMALFLLGIVLVYFMTKRALRSLEQLASDADSLDGQNPEASIRLRRNDSLGRLAANLRSLSIERELVRHQVREIQANLNANRAARRVALVQLDLCLELMEEGVLISDRKSRVVRANQPLSAMFNKGEPLEEGAFCGGGELEPLAEILRRAAQRPEAIHTASIEFFEERDGRMHACAVIPEPQEAAVFSVKPQAFVVVVEDTTENQFLYESQVVALSSYAQKLEPIVKELSSEAQSVMDLLVRFWQPTPQRKGSSTGDRVQRMQYAVASLLSQIYLLGRVIHVYPFFYSLLAGRYKIARQMVAIRSLINQISFRGHYLGGAYGTPFYTRPDDELPEVEVDPDLFLEMLTALVHFALARTHRAGVVLRAARRGAVVDIWIEEGSSALSEHEYLDLFYPHDQMSLLGIELQIARVVAEEHGCSIKAERARGRGNHYLVRVPLKL